MSYGRKTLDKLEEVARAEYGSDDIEIDQLKPSHTSAGGNGVWVRAWVHVSNMHLKDAGIRNTQAYKEEE
jgi:hypothetical protein